MPVVKQTLRTALVSARSCAAIKHVGSQGGNSEAGRNTPVEFTLLVTLAYIHLIAHHHRCREVLAMKMRRKRQVVGYGITHTVALHIIAPVVVAIHIAIL